MDSFITPSSALNGSSSSRIRGLHHHRPRQRRSLLLPAGKLIDFLIQVFFQSQKADQLLHLFIRGDARLVAQAVCNILIYIQIGKQGIILKTILKTPLFHGFMGDILLMEKDFSLIRVSYPQDHIEQRSFSTSAGPQYGYNFPILNIQRNILQYRNTIIRFLICCKLSMPPFLSSAVFS